MVTGYTSRLSIGIPGFDSRSWLPHIIHLFIVYIHRIRHCPTDGVVKWRSLVSALSDGWGRKMAIPCIGAVLRACKRTRVTVVEFHVSLYPISVSPSFLSSIHAKCVNIMTWIAYIALKGRNTPTPPPSVDLLCYYCLHSTLVY